jgi:uncharacterized protein
MSEHFGFPDDGIPIMQAIVGSTAYGLAHDHSDIDRLGVYVAANKYVLGLDGPSVVTRSQVYTDPDTTFHEVGKYFSLALKCNPTILELLFAEQEIEGPGASSLSVNRRLFLSSRRIIDAYGGYATQQAKRLMERHKVGKEGFNSDLRNRTAKHGRHCYRLLIMGAELLRTGSLTLDVSRRREEIFEVGDMAVKDPDGFYEVFRKHLAALEGTSTKLPEENDRCEANRILLDLRKSYG